VKLFRLVLRNLVRNRRRSVLTTLSIALSLFVFTTLTNIPRIADRVLEVSSSSPRIVCHSKSGFTVPLPESHRAAISRIPHVVAISAWSYYGGIYRDPSEQFGNFAVDRHCRL